MHTLIYMNVFGHLLISQLIFSIMCVSENH